jgi:hypothetical protein
MGLVFIYSLSCPETGRVRYIGKANSMRDRLQTHIRDSRKGTRPVCRWVHALLARNMAPVMAIVCESDTEAWEEDECDLIAEYRRVFPDLLNVADGGKAPAQSYTQRAKNGRTAAQVRVATPEDKLLYDLRTTIGQGLAWQRKNDPEGYERLMKLIRPLAVEFPNHFGTWAGL